MSGTPERAMIMAAGKGTRMGELTRTTPKPLLPVGGRPLIDHALDRAAEGGAREAVVNLHHLGEQIRAHLGGRTRPRVAFSDESEALLDTGGGVRKARPLLGEAPVYVLNSDAIWTGAAPLPTLAGAWDGARMDALLHFVRREDAIAYTRAGDFFLEDVAGGVGRPVRRGAAASAPYIYASAQIIRPAAFDGFPDGPFSTNLVWDRLLEAGRLFAVVHEGAWVDVGTQEGLAAAEALLARA
ncbi:nucleotidyltransferase family protein [Albimonas sp. CAU 1670]|uniref:nucleotidyltransferase family protein n=1 Tax=Albimonas sp. CAU 1670 TaxID=3032599 RepID=UPI0023DA59BB|nr:nucleotidyltransferase family protein [Albimonas sp. CAU 1670]MDF2232496.1 nucleotidyltransferase family protein [Albimonas sp. CAU 1670]